jgi:hypothetical protein
MARFGARRAAVVAAALLVAWAGQAASAASIYREDFTDAEANDGTLAEQGWNGTDSIASGGSSSGVFNTFHWWYNNSTLASATTPSGLSYTTENAPISLATPSLTFDWAHRLESQFDDAFGEATGTGTGVDVRPAIQVGGQWYAAATSISTGNADNTTTSGTFSAQSVPINPTAANWVLVNGVDATGGVTLGAAPGANLSGNITGVGLVSTFHQYQTVNFDYVEITGVPEPTSLGLAAGAIACAAASRRRRRC